MENINNNITINETEELTEDLIQIIEVITNKRKELKLSQRDLAEMSGVKQPAIARLEKLKSVPTLSTVAKIAKPLGLKLIFVNE